MQIVHFRFHPIFIYYLAVPVLLVVFPVYLQPGSILNKHTEAFPLVPQVIALVYPIEPTLTPEACLPILPPHSLVLVAGAPVFKDAPATAAIVPPLPEVLCAIFVNALANQLAVAVFVEAYVLGAVLQGSFLEC